MTYISSALRRQVIERANNCCEYCLLSQDSIFFSFEIDHIISQKHGGSSLTDNLCLSCPDCNAYKGSDIASRDSETGQLAALFNPREQAWHDHFRLDEAQIIPLTPEGRVTVNILQLNRPERTKDRQLFMSAGNYPCQR